MPAQAGLTDGDIAAVLNYAMTLPAADAKASPETKPITAAEVAAIKTKHGKVSANAVHAARSGVFAGGATPTPPTQKP
jgi:hypothetical protein